MTDPRLDGPTPGPWMAAVAETNRLQRELDITNADHIALWLEANTIPDEPMSQCISWLAVQIVEAHERAVSAGSTQEDEGFDDRSFLARIQHRRNRRYG